jgi:hypothetical protein
MLAELGLEGFAALVISVGAPIIGGIALIFGLIAEGNTSAPGWRGPGDGGSPRPPLPSDPPRGGGMPLPGAAPLPVRLRGDEILADGYPRRSRRPDHAPQRRPVAPGVPAGGEDRR